MLDELRSDTARLQAEPKQTGSPDNLVDTGIVYQRAGHLSSAINCYIKAIEIDEMCLRAYTQLADCYIKLGYFKQARLACQYARALAPGNAGVHYFEGVCYKAMGKLYEASKAYKRALKIDEGHLQAASGLMLTAREACDWALANKCQALLQHHIASIAENDSTVPLQPFISLLLDLEPSVQAAITSRFIETQYADSTDLSRRACASLQGKKRLNIGYISGDFRNHPVMHLANNLFKHHDTNAFRVFCYSTGPNDESSYRQNVENSCQNFFDVFGLSPREIGNQITAHEIDILVDMSGHTSYNRLDVLALRPAPIQIHFLGYPGTLGAPFVDYFIADHFVCPAGAEENFTENLIYMPHNYQISDDEQRAADVVPSRSEEGLPEGAFVFCAFNSSYKIDPEIFAAWMEILTQVPDGVLWLIPLGAGVEENLRCAAQAKGINPSRLVFARREEKSLHLSRHLLADLFLDTWLVCGHTTVNDALQMGLPVVTSPRSAFVSRVSGSLLISHGLGELICHDLKDYVSKAVALALDRNRLLSFTRKLRQNLDALPARDTGLFVRHLEIAYRQAWTLYASGDSPAPIDVSALIDYAKG